MIEPSNQLSGCDPDMLGRDLVCFFIGSGYECAPGEMIGSSEQAAGTLVDGGYGGL